MALIAMGGLSFAQSLPQDWVGGGVAYNQYVTPNLNGWGSYVHLLSTKGPIYSYSSWDVSRTGTHPFMLETSERTGLATTLKQWGRLTVFGLATAGLSQSSSLGGAFAGGGMAVYQLGKSTWTVELGARIYKSTTSNGQQMIFEFGFGRIVK